MIDSFIRGMKWSRILHHFEAHEEHCLTRWKWLIIFSFNAEFFDISNQGLQASWWCYTWYHEIQLWLIMHVCWVSKYFNLCSSRCLDFCSNYFLDKLFDPIKDFLLIIRINLDNTESAGDPAVQMIRGQIRNILKSQRDQIFITWKMILLFYHCIIHEIVVLRVVLRVCRRGLM